MTQFQTPIYQAARDIYIYIPFTSNKLYSLYEHLPLHSLTDPHETLPVPSPPNLGAFCPSHVGVPEPATTVRQPPTENASQRHTTPPCLSLMSWPTKTIENTFFLAEVKQKNKTLYKYIYIIIYNYIYNYI
jgi:hypothetical protein